MDGVMELHTDTDLPLNVKQDTQAHKPHKVIESNTTQYTTAAQQLVAKSQ